MTNDAIRITLATSTLAAFFLISTGSAVRFDGPLWSHPLETVFGVALTVAFHQILASCKGRLRKT